LRELIGTSPCEARSWPFDNVLILQVGCSAIVGGKQWWIGQELCNDWLRDGRQCVFPQGESKAPNN
jgi:hypothetical protein